MFKLLTLFTILSTTLLPALEVYPQEEWLCDYIERMPWEQYRQYKVEGLGSFWVDNAKDCVKDTIKSGKIWETYIIDCAKKWIKNGDTVVDLGAHMGTITMALSNLVGPTGHVHSFEAERQFYRELFENIKLNKKENITPYLTWIGNKNSEISVNWFYGKEYSPVHNPNEQPYTLKMQRMDDFNFKKIALMKIDVECTEDDVLEGAYETLARCRPVLIIELMGGFGVNPSKKVQAKINHTIGTLNGLGYKVTKIYIDDYLAVPIEKL